MQSRTVWATWLGIVAGPAAAVAVLFVFRDSFDWSFELAEIPAIPFSIGLCLAGLAVLPMPWLVRHSEGLHRRHRFGLLVMIIAAGLGLRLAMFAIQPVLEDDYYRYLWDGAVTASGFNPYAKSPASAQEEGAQSAIGRLAETAGLVMDRINHPDLKTIYPPVAQAAFALSYVIAPWSIDGWRAVCLAGEVVTLLLLLALLRMAGQGQLWIAVYWLNPLIIKEMINSAHMEAILTPLVLGALLLAARRRTVSASAMLGLAAGAKIWPLLLAPLLLRPALQRPRQLLVAIVVLGVLVATWAILPWLGGIDETSGFIAYATRWQTNSALLPVLNWVVEAALGAAQLPLENAGLFARGILGLVLVAIALWTARGAPSGTATLMQRAGIITAALFLLSPAQFPWYAAWMIPFLAFRPSFALLLLTPLLPIYYSSFHFLARDSYDTFRYGLVWLIWLPVWMGLIVERMDKREGMLPDAE